jgi:hypothetical protein
MVDRAPCGLVTDSTVLRTPNIQRRDSRDRGNDAVPRQGGVALGDRFQAEQPF